MKKLILSMLVMVLCCLLFGCGNQKRNASEEYAIWDQSGYGFVTEDGYYFTADSKNDAIGIILYYFDRNTGECIPVCDKAECSHDAVDLGLGEPTTCNAQICTYDEYVIFQNKIYYMDRGERSLILRRRDADGNNDEKVSIFEDSQMGGRMWFYRDYAFLIAITDVSQSFDPGSGESDQSEIYLYATNLNTGETEILAQSSITAAIRFAFNVYKMENGKVYYYDLEKDSWYIFDTETAAVEEQTEIPKKAKYGEAGEYIDMYDQHCYGIFGTVSDGQTIRQLDRETGEESILYEGNPGNDTGYVIWNYEWMCITELDTEHAKLKNMLLYNMQDGEFQQIPESFYDQDGLTIPILGDDEGLVYFIWKDDGIHEKRYATIEEVLKGSGKYMLIEREK